MSVGIVVIGRNEGEKLRRALRSALAEAPPERIIYVDAGSSDGSLALARTLGVPFLSLEGTNPMTAARARNAGVERILHSYPAARHVQFVAGDCELAPGWISRAFAEMTRDPQLAAVCGMRREREPERSVYHRLLALDAEKPAGEIGACDGDALFRIAALKSVGGFCETLPIGEGPEISHRLRREGWGLRRVGGAMLTHDAGPLRFSDWVRRERRAGAALRLVSRTAEDAPGKRATRNLLLWGALGPTATVVLLATRPAGVVLPLTGYAILFARAFGTAWRRGGPAREAWRIAGMRVAALVPRAWGALRAEVPDAKPVPRRPVVGYLSPVYPDPERAGLGREIAAVESAGLSVARFALRIPRELVGPERAEAAATRRLGLVHAPFAAAAVALVAPHRFARALGYALHSPRGQGGSPSRLLALARASALVLRLRRVGAVHLHASTGEGCALVAELARELGGPPCSVTAGLPEEATRRAPLALARQILEAIRPRPTAS